MRWWSAGLSRKKTAEGRSHKDTNTITATESIQKKKKKTTGNSPVTGVLPCICSERQLFCSYRCEACPAFRSPLHQRDKSHSAGRRLRRWNEEVTCLARTEQKKGRSRKHKSSNQQMNVYVCVEDVSLHERSSLHLQPGRTWSRFLLIGHGNLLWLWSSRIVLCLYFVAVTK